VGNACPEAPEVAKGEADCPESPEAAKGEMACPEFAAGGCAMLGQATASAVHSAKLRNMA
jgi:hypothetical protein